MHKNIKSILAVFGIFALITAALFGVIFYKTRYEAVVVDSVQSSDENYELLLQSIGEPYFPFGAAPGRLVLKNDETVVAEANFEIANDGGPFSADVWSVTWYGDRAEVILSGEEQYDELVALYYNGQVERSNLTTHYGVE